MKRILFILFVFATICANAQVSTIPTITGSNSGDGEIKLIVAAAQSNDNSLQTEVTALGDLIETDSARLGAVVYTDTYWDDLRVPLTNTKLTPAKSEPALEEFVTGVYAFGFDTGNDSTESLHFIAQTPHNRSPGSDLECHLHWAPSTTNAGDVRWKLNYTAISIDGTFGAVGSLWVTDAADGTADKHQLSELGTIDGSSLGLSSVIVGNITRLGDHADDDFTGVAFGLEFDFHYEIDSPGSTYEYVK